MSDADDLAQIETLLAACLPTLVFQTSGGICPYAIEPELSRPNFSASTNSMVSHGTAALCGLLKSDILVGPSLLPLQQSKKTVDLEAKAKNALNKTVNEIQSKGLAADSRILKSSAFGNDDPFTLAWLLELLRNAPSWQIPSREHIDTVRDLLLEVSKRRIEEQDCTLPVLNFDDPTDRPIRHPLPLLRLVHLAKIVEEYEDQKFERFYSDCFDWFLAHLHQQLSRRSIQHSGFDITELVFCLEGMIFAGKTRVTGSVLQSVVDALEASRQLNPSFRATTPFKATKTGSVQLFTSVEVVASILRSTSKLDSLSRKAFFEGVKPVLSNYLNWLQATMQHGETRLPEAKGTDPFPDDLSREYRGWHSEHSYEQDDSIDLWLTSQVLVFLKAYESLLSEDIARQALSLAGLATERHMDASSLSSAERADKASLNDPLQLRSESLYRSVSRLEESLVRPRFESNGAHAAFSCLLYGPPGTGKTTLARNVARDLRWPLLTITTSDFIIEGEAQVEARAKAIFDALDRQTKVVIFFDEIDRLILDRDAPDYAHQGDMLQFMTPSMLTKINDLRQRQRCIFIIGTNYADRIDSAIKRPGRIDHRLLVLPPDLARRRTILRDELDQFVPQGEVNQDAIDQAASLGVGRTIAELKSAVRDFARIGGSLPERVHEIAPAITLSTYKKRLAVGLESTQTEGSSSKTELLEEAYMLAYLIIESGQELGGEDSWIRENWVAVRGTSGVIKDDEVRAKLDEKFGAS